jgi:hypothetical protein
MERQEGEETARPLITTSEWDCNGRKEIERTPPLRRSDDLLGAVEVVRQIAFGLAICNEFTSYYP